MKTAIVYGSVHHGNTKKLVDAIAAKHDVTLIDATKEAQYDLSGFDMIGFASGIYFTKYHATVISFAQKNLPSGKAVFFMHTAGSPAEKQSSAIKAIADSKNCSYKGTYFCKGFDTYGPFKLIGGIAKGHPTNEDVDGAVAFFSKLA